MKPTLIAAAIALSALTACTPAQQTAAITIAASAFPCYVAVNAATQTGSNAVKALTAAQVAALDPSCKDVGVQAAALIASAINAQAPVVKGAVSLPAARKMPG